MKALRVVGLAALMLLAALAVPHPASPALPARADHTGIIECPQDPPPVHDGVVAPGEYAENFFDPKTKILVYFDCATDADLTMHVALVSPSEHATELRVQAAEAWNGDLNVVRASFAESSLQVSDGFLNGTSQAYVDDVAAGGSFDVVDPAAKEDGDAFVYEFGLPLLSPDGLDCQLTGNGSFFFQLAYVTVGGMQEDDAPMVSEPHVIRIGKDLQAGTETSVEVSLPAGNAPREPAEILLSVRDANGTPLASRLVSAFARTAFDFLDLGTAYTNDQGVASVSYTPLGAGEYLVGSAFSGGDGYLANVAWRRLVIGPAASDPGALPPGLHVVEAIITLMVGGVWVTYAYAAFLVGSALREPKEAPPRVKGGWKPWH